MTNKNYIISLGLLLLFIGIVLGIFHIRHNESILSSVPPFSDTNEHNQASNPAVSNGKININIASAEELSYLPGIGTTLAIRIVQYRIQNGSFTKINQLLNVDGMTTSTFEKLQSYITIN